MFTKFIYDNVHKQIPINPILLQIVNTKPFQRLRFLKQLGMAWYVFPTATHTRFEHSIGVCYLAGKLLKSIREKQSELNITDEDIFKVELAGLCHDLGHGPFSHSFDHFIESIGIKSQHEERSVKIMEYIIIKYKIPISKEIIDDVKDLILPGIVNSKNNKSFLYEIVANSKSGLDVDKFDYLRRDTYQLGFYYSIDLERIIENARIINGNICYPDKLAFSINNIYETRARLHKEVYNHPVVKSIEIMMNDMLKETEYDWNKYVNDVELFLTLNDDLMMQTMDIPKNAIQIRENMLERHIYKYIGQIIIPTTVNGHLTQLLSEFKLEHNILDDSDYILDMIHIGYIKNPIMKIRFYNPKKNMGESFLLNDRDISPLICTNLEEKSVRFYVKKNINLDKGEYYLKQFRNYIDQYLYKLFVMRVKY